MFLSLHTYTTVLVVLVFATLYSTTTGDDIDEALWQSLQFVIDTGALGEEEVGMRNGRL